LKDLRNVYKYSYKNGLLKPRLVANIKEVQQQLYASITMGIFDKSNYIVSTSITEQFFQCTTEMILLAKMIKLWTFYDNVVHS